MATYSVHCVLFVVALLSVLPEHSWSIKIERVEVPRHPVVGGRADLVCPYILETDRKGQTESLYSVKWYKDRHEFYRYVPKDKPRSQVFNVAWITVDKTRSNQRVVSLRNLSLGNSGVYACEVSSEAPFFKTALGSGQMEVIDLPDDRPIISGANIRGYRVGEWLDVNCTSRNSNPPAKLKWYINDEKPTESYNVAIPPQKENSGLYTARLRLRFQLKRQHFVQGHVSLKCTASIYKEYFTSTSAIYPGLGLGEKALESRRTNDGWRTRATTSLVAFGVLLMFYLAK